MKLKIATIRILSFLGLLLALSSLARAYDIDVHFYQTYSMARYAGLKHEAAALIAAAAQWPDETMVVASPFYEFKSRRLFHFPCFSKGIALEGNRLGEKVDKDDPVQKARAEHTEWCETRHDHAMAYLLLYEGLCHDCDPKTKELVKDEALKGDLLKAATSLHTIEDSYAHEGTPSEIGHAAYGHWPDRPYNPDGSVDKVYQMFGSAMYAIVALRETLGGAGGKYCDLDVRDQQMVGGLDPSVPNCKRGADQLALGYRNLPIVKATISRNILLDPNYVEHVMRWALMRMQNVAHSETSGRLQFWLNPAFNVVKWLYQQQDAVAMMRSGKSDVYAVMKLIFPRLYNLDPAKTADDLWIAKPAYTPKKYIVSKYALMSNLYWLDTPDPKVRQLDREIHEFDSLIRDLMTQISEAKKKRKVDQALIASLRKQVSDRSLSRDQKQEEREELRIALVKGYEAEYYKDPTHTFNGLMNDMVETMLYTNVPRPLDDRHRFEYETDSAYPRRLELEMRISYVRSMIQKLYGTNVHFIPNKADWAFSKYQNANPDQTKDFVYGDAVVDPDVAWDLKDAESLVTFNYRQINLWNDQMLRYTFPLLSDVFASPGTPLIEEFSDSGSYVKMAWHAAEKIWSAGIRASWDLAEKDYLTTHLVSPLEMTARIKNPDELKQRVDSKEFRFNEEQLGFLENLDGPKRSHIKDATPGAVGILRQPQVSTVPRL